MEPRELSDAVKARTRARNSAPISAARRQRILALLSRGDALAVGDLASRFNTSPETIRRDIRGLENEGLLKRVHGGILPVQTIDLTARRPIRERIDIDPDAKRLAAKAAVSLISDNMTVFLDGGSTLLFVAEALVASGKTVSVTTNMIKTAITLAASPTCTVSLLGGTVNPRNFAVGGHEVMRALEDRLFDMAVIGGSALNLDHGFLGPSRNHVELARVLALRSNSVTCVMDRGKIGRTDAHILLALDQVSAFATDGDLAPEDAEKLAQAGMRVVTPLDSGGQRA